MVSFFQMGDHRQPLHKQFAFPGTEVKCLNALLSFTLHVLQATDRVATAYEYSPCRGLCFAVD